LLVARCSLVILSGLEQGSTLYMISHQRTIEVVMPLKTLSGRLVAHTVKR
jgi:hypothetical protein